MKILFCNEKVFNFATRKQNLKTYFIMEHSNNQPDMEVVASIYKMYYNDLKLYLLSYTHNTMAAEDMLQDIFLKVMSLDIITIDTAKSLLLVMAKRMIIDDARHKAFVRESERHIKDSINQLERSPMQRIEAADMLSFEQRHLAKMPAKRANIYKMYKHNGIPADKIADMLSLSKRTVEAHIYMSTKDMRSYLRKIV